MLRRFLLPPVSDFMQGTEFERDWPAGGDWSAN